jgi:hypothetical protein
MDATEAALMVREYLCGVPGILPDIGFETGDISRFDFKEWEIECRVFSMLASKMVGYRVVIHDDKVEAIKRIDCTDRERYIDEHLNVIRERQLIELERARRFFGEEWDMEHSDD